MEQRHDSVTTLSIRYRASTPKVCVLRGDGVQLLELAQEDASMISTHLCQ
jgi:hypothetical protein